MAEKTETPTESLLAMMADEKNVVVFPVIGKNREEFKVVINNMLYKDGTVMSLRVLKTEDGWKVSDMGETVGWVFEVSGQDINSSVYKSMGDICALYDVEWKESEIFCMPEQKGCSLDYAIMMVAAASLVAASIGFCSVSYSFNLERKQKGFGEFSAWYTGEAIEI